MKWIPGPYRFKEDGSRRRKEADTLPTLPPRYLGGYETLETAPEASIRNRQTIEI